MRNRQYHCKDCGAYRVLKPKQGYTQSFRQQVLRAARERVSLSGIEQHVAQLPTLLETLLPVQLNDVLEVDEARSFVVRKAR